MINVTHDKSPKGAPREHCAFCGESTNYWYVPNDVPVCLDCAGKRIPSDVPSKRDWLVANGSKLPVDWKCNADRVLKATPCA